MSHEETDYSRELPAQQQQTAVLKPQEQDLVNCGMPWIQSQREMIHKIRTVEDPSERHKERWVQEQRPMAQVQLDESCIFR